LIFNKFPSGLVYPEQVLLKVKKTYVVFIIPMSQLYKKRLY